MFLLFRVGPNVLEIILEVRSSDLPYSSLDLTPDPLSSKASPLKIKKRRYFF
jgi:hypothetical protein